MCFISELHSYQCIHASGMLYLMSYLALWTNSGAGIRFGEGVSESATRRNDIVKQVEELQISSSHPKFLSISQLYIT